MICLHISGGLGNQLFQYATARSVALRHNVDLVVDLRFYDQGTNGTAKGVWLCDLPVEASFKRHDAARIGPHNGLRRGLERLLIYPFRDICIDPGLGFDDRVSRLGRNATLVGFFQCYRYFEDAWPTISRELDMSRFVDADSSDDSPWTAVHVRRGDYAGDPRFEMEDDGHYYRSAMEHISRVEPGTRFVVFSDDIAWCREQRWLAGCEFHCGASGRHPAVDLSTMAQASHIVIANSSYSWWAAWIGRRPGRTVVAPALWIDGRASAEIDMTPGDWITI